jgi:hypothetical protein
MDYKSCFYAEDLRGSVKSLKLLIYQKNNMLLADSMVYLSTINKEQWGLLGLWEKSYFFINI